MDWLEENLEKLFTFGKSPKNGFISRSGLEAMEKKFGMRFSILKTSKASVFKFIDGNLKEYE